MEQLHDLKQNMGTHFAIYIATIKDSWKSSEEKDTAVSTRNAMECLLKNSPETEPWVAKLLVEKQRHAELYRDEEHGFIQMGHYHSAGHGSPPHDHGQHWVVYGVYSGEIEISTYRLNESAGNLEVFETHRLTSGDAYAYLPGEIHSTRVINSNGSAVLRFLSTDLKKVNRARYSWDQIEISL